MAGITCEYCGTVCEPGLTVCPSCGSKLPYTETKSSLGGSRGASAASQQQTKQAVGTSDPANSTAAKVILFVGLGLLLIVAIIVTFSILTSDKKNNIKQNSLPVPTFSQLDLYREDTNGGTSTLAVQLAALRSAGNDQEKIEQTKAAIEQYLSVGKTKEGLVLASAAYNVTGNEEFVTLRNAHQPSEAFQSDNTSVLQALQLYFDKSVDSLEWSDLDSLRYLSLHSDYIVLGTSLPEDATTETGTDIRSIQVDEHVSLGEEVALFGSLETLLSYIPNGAPEYIYAYMPKLSALKLQSTQSENLLGLASCDNIRSLSVAGSTITALDGVEKMTALESLEVVGTNIESLSLLGSCQQMRSLTLEDNDLLTSFSSLNTLTGLEELHIRDTEVMDFAFIAQMKALRSLTIENTGAKDIGIIEGLTELEELAITSNSEVKSYEGIGNLTKLTSLAIDGNLEGLDEISSLRALEHLSIARAGDMSILSGLGNLQTLTLQNYGGMSGTAVLGTLNNLEELKIYSTSLGGGTVFESIESIGDLKNLQKLTLQGQSFYKESTAIFDLPSLQQLTISDCTIWVNPSRMSGLTSLKTLSLENNTYVKNIQVDGSGGIYSMYWDDISASDMAAGIAGITSLQWLSFTGTSLDSCEFVTSCQNIEYLDLSNNYIVDMSPLLSLSKLKTVNLTGDPIRDWNVLEAKPSVQLIR